MSANLPIVIYDGECDFCFSCVKWLAQRCQIDARPNQSIDPSEFGVTRLQCEESVVVIDGDTYFGAQAVARMLARSGFRLAARAILLAGPIAQAGYKYVAAHRSGRLVALLHWLVKKTTR